MDDLPDALNRLAARLETLERRVCALEHPTEATSALPERETTPAQAAQAVAAPSIQLSGGAFSVLGKAMLGIAGAYLLRAVAESSSLPKLAIAAVAIAYALAWLLWASRAKAGEWLASTTYACTSALILAPMLWELTLRFKVLPAAMSAGVLCGFVLSATALAWKRNLLPILWVGNITAVAIALTLSIASHDLGPFIGVLLIMVLICEYGAGRNHETGVRVLAALAADVGVWVLLYIYSSAESARVDYRQVSAAKLLVPGIALFAIFGASVLYRTVARGMKITVFETIETMIAFLLAVCSVIYFGPAASTAVLGIACVALSATGYAITFVFFGRDLERRNYRVFASWSAALLLAGIWMCLPAAATTACLGAAAIAGVVLGVRLKRMVLEFHGLVYLIAAAAVSGLVSYVLQVLAGTLPGAPEWSIYLASACAVLCYAGVQADRGEAWTKQALHLAFATLAVGAVAALLVQGLAGLIALSVLPGAHHLAFIRTLSLCVAAVGLTFGGAHWRRIELTRMGYAALALVAVKLVAEDLRHGSLEYIAGAIFLFAMTLIAVPRVARMGQKV